MNHAGCNSPVRLEPLRMLCSPPRLCCYRDSKYTIEEVGAKLQTLDQRHGASLLHTSITPLPNDNPVRVRDVRQLPPVLDDRAVHRAGVPSLAVLHSQCCVRCWANRLERATCSPAKNGSWRRMWEKNVAVRQSADVGFPIRS